MTKLACQLCKKQKNSENLCTKGEKQVGKIVNGEKGETTIALVCMNDVGMQLYTSYADIQEMNAFLMKDVPSESIADTSRSGWINEVLFTK